MTEILKFKPAIPNKVLNPDGTYSTINDVISATLDTDLFIVVEELPDVGESNKIYLLLDENKYIEYYWTGEDWDIIGSVDVDLSDYPTKQETTSAINTATSTFSNSTQAYTNETITQYIASILPIGYRQLNYIASTGTQYINTGIVPSKNYKFEIKYRDDAANGSNYVMSSRSNSDATIYAGVGGGISTQAITVINHTCTTPDNYRVAGYIYKVTATYDEDMTGISEIDCLTTGEVFTGAQNAILDAIEYVKVFCSHYTQHHRGMSLYYLKIWNDGVLVRDFIPCKNPQNEVGLYDLVSKAFFSNQGSGEFIAGEEPFEKYYQRVEYIESTGTQYINTEVMTNTTDYDSFKIKASVRWNDDDIVTNQIMGADFGQFIGIRNSIYRIGTYDTAIRPSSVKFDNIEYTGNYSTKICNYKINNITGTYTRESEFRGKNIYILGLQTTYSESYCKCKLKRFQFYQNKKVMLDCIPCYRKSDHTAGLYDLVNDKFYTNDGTGEFIVGPNIE